MAYVFQSFAINQIHTAAQMNQTEFNARDHLHGISGVSQTFDFNEITVLARDVSAETISNSVTPRIVFSQAVAGGRLGTNRAIRLIVIGKVLQNIGSAADWTVKARYGGNPGMDFTFSLGTDADERAWRFELYLSARDATNSQILWGRLTMSDALTNATSGLGQPEAGPRVATLERTADSTVSQTLEVEVTHGATGASFTTVVYTSQLEYLR